MDGSSFPVDMPLLPSIGQATAAVGIKPSGNKDLLLLSLPEHTSVAGMLTTSACASAPVRWCRQCLQADSHVRALIVNSGNANALTGLAGMQAVKQSVQAVSENLGCLEHQVLVASTGVIGESLPIAKITATVPDLVRACGQGATQADKWHQAAKAIMTTDQDPKGAQATFGTPPVHIVAIAKGAGMIAPNMATTLVFLFTNAAVPDLSNRLNKACSSTMNAISVDGDMSTSDTLLLFATNAQSLDAKGLADFDHHLHGVLASVAQQIVRDGEGASKFITTTVGGAGSDMDARIIAFAVANSLLVKTAMAGSAPNWGRIAMAVGASGVAIDCDQLSITIAGHQVCANGARVPDYDPASLAKAMQAKDIDIEINVGQGNGTFRSWSSDITQAYLNFNADYRS